jgi:hypothetical protein
MPNHIRNTNHVPPGNYYYKLLLVDGREERFFGVCKGNPACKLFGPSPTIDEPANHLRRFRIANNLPRQSLLETTEDISLYTCERINGNPQWCIDTDQSYGRVNPAPMTPQPCPTCGQKLN